MKIAFHLAHPAHYHLFKHAVKNLIGRGHNVIVTYNHKDILADLVRRRELGSISLDIRSDKRTNGLWGLIHQFVQKEVGFYRVMRHYRPDVMLGTSIIVAHAGWLLRIPSVIVNEDDFDVVAGTARIGYPFCRHIIVPACCRTGRWKSKVISYEGYHELAYLAPANFTPDRSRITELIRSSPSYFILRLADLSAHHDVGRTGLGMTVARELITRLEPHGRVYITSERVLEPELEPYRISIDPLRMHDTLYFASMYVGDSQTMAAEAAVLGTPSLRFNDFVGEISYLEELEHRYELTYGIPTSEPDRLYAKIEELLATPDRKKTWAARRRRMLEEKIDLTAFLVWFIEHYPQSVEQARTNPSVMDQFRLQVSEYP